MPATGAAESAVVNAEVKVVQVAARTLVKELCARFAGQLPELYKVKSCFGRHVMTEVIDVVLCSSCPSECGRSNGLVFRFTPTLRNSRA